MLTYFRVPYFFSYISCYYLSPPQEIWKALGSFVRRGLILMNGTQSGTFFGRQGLRHSAVLIFLGLFALFTPAGLAQQGALSFYKNYFVTGDYVVGGVGLRGIGDITGFASGIIKIPDTQYPSAKVPGAVASGAVPAEADIVAAFLYWQTVEKSRSVFAGRQDRKNV